MRKLLPKLIIARLILVFSITMPGPAMAIEIGQTLPLQKIQTLDGTYFEVPKNNTKNTLIQLWASWCPFCQRQNTYLENFTKRIPPGSMHIITISIDKTPVIAKEYMRKHRYTFSAAMMTPELSQAIGKIRGVPVLLILDSKNKLIYKEIGEVFEEDFAELSKYAK
ncbi:MULTISPECIES: TlpA disulfide reductase family protein [unclassified Polynucleobacter]|uniref:TlpA family protein disulfide reductase n=2 Tax=Polynucleobacter TaxID=44013 RepID=UPI001F212D5C|nr:MULTISPECIES: TlpA disulfide reductase family protein [unclassified Polynucleobacter]MCE7526360.1 TlpA family protein disulfide reductase [Polynucleobacter sp. IMCC 30228]MCE7530664.1 TlpA family protein disulfide reductase [Polynucleobacter sp. IMCC 29146]